MGRIAYVNGRYAPHSEAFVHIEDRGFQFADSVYEVWAVFGGSLADEVGHFERLARSLGELRIPVPMTAAALKSIIQRVVRLNRVSDGLAYLQVTRGVAPRDHPFPNPAPRPSVVVTAKSVDMRASEARAARGVAVITTPETRWARCDIKTTGLLPNVLAKQAAREAGAVEAWFVDELGLVTEGGSSNAWIIDADGVLRTRDIQSNILRGVTRRSLLGVVQSLGIPFEERGFSVEEAKSAKEAFITGAGSLVLPVIRIDETLIGAGTPGPVAKRLRELYIEGARPNAA
ncbi:MAG: D-amino-acid transaminase [Caulobacteraceae bacterium]|nr:D-amino-acid transaminase [Caulobacteraceae bacterium]